MDSETLDVGETTLHVSGGVSLPCGDPERHVRFVEGATHSLITDERERFGATVAEWLATLD